jgi:histone-lysine N-methyltransferase MLL3
MLVNISEYCFGLLLQCSDEGPMRAVGLGKGKPFCASKIAKKKLGLSCIAGRPKGIGKGANGVGKVVGGYQKRPRVTEFGRKRAPKAKMRGIFGVPGLGLQVRTISS